MDEQVAVFLVGPRSLGQEFPAAFTDRPRVAGRFKLAARPEDRPLGGGVEPVRVEHGPLVVVAQQADLAIHHLVDAFLRIRPVPDDIAQTVDLRDPLGFDVGQHRLDRFEVTVDIADECFHIRYRGRWSELVGPY
jgi:hypothetical protein